MKKKNGVRYIQGTDSRTTNTGLLAGFTSLGFVKFIDAFVGNGCVIFFPKQTIISKHTNKHIEITGCICMGMML